MFKPMLAAREDPLSCFTYFKNLKYPLLCSPKYDGIRCLIKGSAMSRTFKPIPSLQVQENFCGIQDLDGELIEGISNDPNVYNRTQSYVMSENKPGNITYFVFDYTHPDWLNKTFIERLDRLPELFNEKEVFPNEANTLLVTHELIENHDHLLIYEEYCLKNGFEGIIMRDPLGRYKNGRSTFREGLMYKLKRFQDAEGIIIDFVEGELNKNIQERDELGYSKRTTFKAGMIPAGTLGHFIIDFNGEHIDVAPGCLTHVEKQTIWNAQSNYVGRILKFRHFTHGVKDKPRFPRAIGFRDKMDIGE